MHQTRPNYFCPINRVEELIYIILRGTSQQPLPLGYFCPSLPLFIRRPKERRRNKDAAPFHTQSLRVATQRQVPPLLCACPLPPGGGLYVINWLSQDLVRNCAKIRMTFVSWHLIQQNDRLSFANIVLYCLHKEQQHLVGRSQILEAASAQSFCDLCSNINHMQERREIQSDSRNQGPLTSMLLPWNDFRAGNGNSAKGENNHNSHNQPHQRQNTGNIQSAVSGVEVVTDLQSYVLPCSKCSFCLY